MVQSKTKTKQKNEHANDKNKIANHAIENTIFSTRNY